MSDWVSVANSLRVAGFSQWEIDSWINPLRNANANPDSYAIVDTVQPDLRTADGQAASVLAARMDWWESEGVNPQYIRFLDADIENDGEDVETLPGSPFKAFIDALPLLEDASVRSTWNRAWQDNLHDLSADLPNSFPFLWEDAQATYTVLKTAGETLTSAGFQLGAYLFGCAEGVIGDSLKAYDEAQHPRYPKGHPLAGQWMPKGAIQSSTEAPRQDGESEDQELAANLGSMMNGLELSERSFKTSDGKVKKFRVVKHSDPNYHSFGPKVIDDAEDEIIAGVGKRTEAMPFPEALEHVQSFVDNFNGTHRQAETGPEMALSNGYINSKIAGLYRDILNLNDVAYTGDNVDLEAEYNLAAYVQEKIVTPLGYILNNNEMGGDALIGVDVQVPEFDPKTGSVNYTTVRTGDVALLSSRESLREIATVSDIDPGTGTLYPPGALAAIKQHRQQMLRDYRKSVTGVLERLKNAGSKWQTSTVRFEKALHVRMQQAVYQKDVWKSYRYLDGFQFDYSELKISPVNVNDGEKVIHPLIHNRHPNEGVNDYDTEDRIIKAQANQRCETVSYFTGLYRRMASVISSRTLNMYDLVNKSGYVSIEARIRHVPSKFILSSSKVEQDSSGSNRDVIDYGDAASQAGVIKTGWWNNPQWSQEIEAKVQYYGNGAVYQKKMVKDGLVITLRDDYEYNSTQPTSFRASASAIRLDSKSMYKTYSGPQLEEWQSKNPTYLAARMNLGFDSNLTTFAHEFGHVLEDQYPNLRVAAINFLKWRTYGESDITMNEATQSTWYSDYEVTRPDKFISPYIGKRYISKGKVYGTEVVSMGLEAMISRPYHLMKNDKEHFDFMVRVMLGDPAYIGGDPSLLDTEKTEWK